jgi:mono/diheme cytochrome c family protein
MRYRPLITSALLFGIALGAALVWAVLFAPESETPVPEATPANQNISESASATSGQQIYDQNCGSCHGADLEGEPGFDWRNRKSDGSLPAPPHDQTGHTWHHPDPALILIIQNGGLSLGTGIGKSTMPAFGEVLSETEIEAVLTFIKSRWPDKIRAQQEKITANAQN